MAPPPSSLLTLTFALALLTTLFVAASLRLLAILPPPRSSRSYSIFSQPRLSKRKRPLATRVMIVLGSGGHTHEMFDLLRDLNTRKWTHRTYIVSSGDAFSAQRARDFEKGLEDKKGREGDMVEESCVGPSHYDIALLPRARRIHQPLYTTPLTCLKTLVHTFTPLLSTRHKHPAQTPYEAASHDLPDLILTNGPATAVIVIIASLLLRFFNIRGANSRGKCRTIYVESFARVKTLSLSGKLLVWVVDRFLVQWEELEGAGGGRAEFCGILV